MNITKHPLFEEVTLSFEKLEFLRGSVNHDPKEVEELAIEEAYFNKLFRRCLEIIKKG